MLDQAQLILAMHDSARYVADRHAFILAYLLRANLLVDSIMQGDNSAKAASGWNGSGQSPASHYSALWQYCRGFTQRLLQNYPNPFNGRSEISFEVPRGGWRWFGKDSGQEIRGTIGAITILYWKGNHDEHPAIAVAVLLCPGPDWARCR
jgi:hypothetical protein